MGNVRKGLLVGAVALAPVCLSAQAAKRPGVKQPSVGPHPTQQSLRAAEDVAEYCDRGAARERDLDRDGQISSAYFNWGPPPGN